jgi:probable HAF family extracellular repeat protein
VNYSVTDLGTQFSTTSGAIGINNSGEVVGTYQGSNGSTQSFVYNNGTFTSLAPVNGYAQVNPVAINNNGLVLAVDSQSSGTTTTNVLYSGGTSINLGTLNGLTVSENRTSECVSHSRYSTLRFASASQGEDGEAAEHAGDMRRVMSRQGNRGWGGNPNRYSVTLRLPSKVYLNFGYTRTHMLCILN